MVATLGVGLINFFLVPFMVAKLGIVAFGLVVIINIFSLGGYLSLLELGFQTSITKYVAQYTASGENDKINGLVNSTFVFYLGIAFLVFVVASLLCGNIVALFDIPDDFADQFKFSLYLIFFSYLYQFPNFVFIGLLQGAHRFDVLKSVELLMSVFRAVGCVLLLCFGHGFFAVIVLTLFLLLFQCIAHVYFSKRHFPFLRFGTKYVRMGALMEIKSMSGLIFVGKFASLLFSQTDKILIGIFLGPLYMAWYEIVIKLPAILKQSLGFMNLVVVPAASELHVSGRSATLRKLFLRGLRYQVYLAYPLILAAAYYARPFLKYWAGEDLIFLAPLLQLQLAVNLLQPLANYGGSLLLGMNVRLKEFTLISVFSALLNLAVTILLIEKYQLRGVVIGTIAGVALALIASFYFFLREFEIKLFTIFKEAFLIALCFFVSVATAWTWRWFLHVEDVFNYLAQTLLWVVVFFAMIFAICLNKEEKVDLAFVLKLKKRSSLNLL